MKKRIKISEDKFWDIKDQSDTVEIATGSWRWGYSTTYVSKIDNKFYKYTVQYHCEEGAQIFGDIDAYEVQSVEVTKTEWQAVTV